MAFDAWGGAIYTYCARRLPEDEAADATQEVFVSAWRSRTQFDPERGVLAQWLFGIARNTCVTFHRRRARVPEPMADPPGGASRPTDDDGLENRLLLLGALEQLPDRQRRVLLASFKEDWTNAEVADRLGLPLGTVKSDIRPWPPDPSLPSGGGPMSARDDHPLHPNLADALGADTEHAAELDAIARRLADLDQRDVIESPPDGLWAAIDAEVSGAEATSTPVVALGPRRSRRTVRVALGAAAAVLVVVAVAAVLRDDDASPTTEQVALEGLPDFADVSGSAIVTVDGSTRSLGVDLSDVDVPPGSHLELWLLDEPVEQLVPLGPLGGAGPHAIPEDVDLTATPIVDVSLELDDGNPAHSGVSVARGRIEPA